MMECTTRRHEAASERAALLGLDLDGDTPSKRVREVVQELEDGAVRTLRLWVVSRSDVFYARNDDDVSLWVERLTSGGGLRDILLFLIEDFPLPPGWKRCVMPSRGLVKEMERLLRRSLSGKLGDLDDALDDAASDCDTEF